MTFKEEYSPQSITHLNYRWNVFFSFLGLQELSRLNDWVEFLHNLIAFRDLLLTSPVCVSGALF